MSIYINDNCICCDACVELCSKKSISYDKEKDFYIVNEDTCDECNNESFILCASICPIENCIVWGQPNKDSKLNNKSRGNTGEKVDN